MSPTLPSRQVGNTAARVTALGFGGAALGNLYSEVGESDAQATIAAALAAGIGYYDTAPFYGYGLSETRLGIALEAADGPVTRSSKVGRRLEPRSGGAREDQGFIAALPFDPVFDYSYDGVMRSFESSLKRLRVDHIEIVLIHDLGELTHGPELGPKLFRIAMDEGYLALDELRRAGSIDAIGLGVNEPEVCLAATEAADFDCFLLAGRYTLLEQGAIESLLPRCEARGISLLIGGPYNSGILVEPPEAVLHYDYAEADTAIRARVAALRAVCDAHRVPLGAAALQFPLLHPAVASVLPGARCAAEVEQNAEWLGLELPAQLWRDLRAEGLLHPAAPIVVAAEATR